jgi:hypothetical protein
MALVAWNKNEMIFSYIARLALSGSKNKELKNKEREGALNMKIDSWKINSIHDHFQGTKQERVKISIFSAIG